MAKRTRVLPSWMRKEEPDELSPSKISRKTKVNGDNLVADHIAKKEGLVNLVCKVESDGANELDQTKNLHQMSDEEEDLETNKFGNKKETLKMKAISAGKSSTSNIVVKKEIKKELDETSLNQLSDEDSNNLQQMSSVDQELNQSKIKKEIKKEESINALEINDDAESSSSNNIKKETGKEIKDTNLHQISDEEDSSTNSQDEAKESAAGGNPPKKDSSAPEREPCKYGSNCYRKNPQHCQEFSHPGDDDHKDKPECQFGTSCYRKNQLHRSHYKHTKPPLRNATQKLKKQRDHLEDDEDDDYDFDDPFLNDNSSDDYQPTDTESDDDDDDDDSIKEEESDSKRMLKEAKKFAKKK